MWLSIGDISCDVPVSGFLCSLILGIGRWAEDVSASEQALLGAAFWVVAVSIASGSNFNCWLFCEGWLKEGTKLLASGNLGTGTGLDLSSGTRASGAILTSLRNCLFRFVTFLFPIDSCGRCGMRGFQMTIYTETYR